jgi:hypothetical protein
MFHGKISGALVSLGIELVLRNMMDKIIITTNAARKKNTPALASIVHNVFIIFYRSANINTGDIIYQITCRQDPEADAKAPIAQANQFLCRVTNEL